MRAGNSIGLNSAGVTPALLNPTKYPDFSDPDVQYKNSASPSDISHLVTGRCTFPPETNQEGLDFDTIHL